MKLGPRGLSPTFPLVSVWFWLPSSRHTFKGVGSRPSPTSDSPDSQLPSRCCRSNWHCPEKWSEGGRKAPAFDHMSDRKPDQTWFNFADRLQLSTKERQEQKRDPDKLLLKWKRQEVITTFRINQFFPSFLKEFFNLKFFLSRKIRFLPYSH